MDSPFEEAQKLTNAWTEFATKLASAGMTMDHRGDKPAPDMARQVRAATLATLSQSAQQFMRSEPFLEMMKKSMDGAIAWQRQMSEFLTKAHHAGESVARSDVDDLHRSVRHLERRTLDQIEQLASKLDQISLRLDAMEGKPSADSNGNIQACGGRQP